MSYLEGHTHRRRARAWLRRARRERTMATRCIRIATEYLRAHWGALYGSEVMGMFACAGRHYAMALAYMDRREEYLQRIRR